MRKNTVYIAIGVLALIACQGLASILVGNGINPFKDGTSLNIKVIDRGSVDALAFSPDGKLLASSSMLMLEEGSRAHGGGVQIWNSQTGVLQRTVAKYGEDTYPDTVGRIFFSPNGEHFLQIDSKLLVWNVKSWKIERKIVSGSWADISPDNKLMALPTSYEVDIWGIKPWKFKYSFPVGMDPSAVEFAPDNKSLAIAYSHWDSVVFLPGGGKKGGNHAFQVKLWDLKNRKFTQTMRHYDVIKAISFSPDGKKLATASGTTVQLWNLSNRKVAQTWKHASVVNTLLFSPDGMKLAIANGSTVQLWNLNGQKITQTFKHASVVSAIAFSPDGKTLATGSRNGLIQIRRLSTNLNGV